MMGRASALTAFAALAQETRLQIVRLLVQADQKAWPPEFWGASWECPPPPCPST